MWSLFKRGSTDTAVPPAEPQVVPLPDDGRIPVTGESHYQPALRSAVRGRAAGYDFDDHLPVTAVLVPEPTNRYDRNAVRVDVVDGTRTATVGYLERELAGAYQPVLSWLRDHGRLGSCPARVTGGGEKFYGIYLHLAEARLVGMAIGAIDPVVAERTAGTVLLCNDRTCTVTREESHQDVLAGYAPRKGQDVRTVVATLDFCTIDRGKHRGTQAIEIRLGGQRVGQLTKLMSERYDSIVRGFRGHGVQVTCEAFTFRTPKGVEVELRLPMAT
jgi:hypothetical protein